MKTGIFDLPKVLLSGLWIRLTTHWRKAETITTKRSNIIQNQNSAQRKSSSRWILRLVKIHRKVYYWQFRVTMLLKKTLDPTFSQFACVKLVRYRSPHQSWLQRFVMKLTCSGLRWDTAILSRWFFHQRRFTLQNLRILATAVKPVYVFHKFLKNERLSSFLNNRRISRL